MRVIFSIAFRNVMLNRRRSLLLGFAIFLSSFLLLLTNSTMNGVESQVLRGYINLQSGEVAVIWEDVKKIDSMDSGKFIGNNISFDVNKEPSNRTAISRLNEFLSENSGEVKAVFPTIRRSGTMFLKSRSSKKEEDTLIIYSLSDASAKFILDTKTLGMEAGKLLSGEDNIICISKEKADDYGLKLGDTIRVEGVSPQGISRKSDFKVAGIYANGAGYDNMYGFVSEQNARALFGFNDVYFDICRVYLKNQKNISSFAHRLDSYLTAASPVLRADTYAEASAFYTSTSRNIKLFFIVFNFFLFIMIAIGLRSTLKMNIFDRMKEFGTLRAIGYSRFRCFSIIFCEVFFMSVIALAVAFAVAGIFVTIFGNIGIYVGSGGVSYALGGESFFPRLKIGDILYAFFVILLFSLISTFGPGLKLCYQTITDIMLKKQKKVSVIKGLAMSLAELTKKRIAYIRKVN